VFELKFQRPRFDHGGQLFRSDEIQFRAETVRGVIASSLVFAARTRLKSIQKTCRTPSALKNCAANGK
jgi:hypothetical protein